MNRAWSRIAERLRQYVSRSSGLTATTDDIRFAYRLLLGREPDDSGLKAFRGMLMTRSLTPPDIASAILGSDEFLGISQEKLPFVQIELPGRLMCLPNDDRDIAHEIKKNLRYEPGVEKGIHTILRAGSCFIDIGANLGYFSLLAASIVGEKGTILAVEPLDRNLQCLYASVIANSFSQICIYPYAAADKRCIVSLTTDPGTSNAQIMDSAASSCNSIPQRASGIALDQLFLNLSSVDLVKIDVEGMEPKVWFGMTKLLSRCRPAVIIEFHPEALRRVGADPMSFLKQLQAYGAMSILHDDAAAEICYSCDCVWAQFKMSPNRTHVNLCLQP